LQVFFQLSAGNRAHTVKPGIAAIDMEAMEKYRAAYKINDTFGMSELISHERILHLGPHTSVLVLESAVNWSGLSDSVLRWRVRILEGQYQGKAAWIADNFMVADAPPAT
jgi:hypothetical protein